MDAGRRGNAVLTFLSPFLTSARYSQLHLRCAGQLPAPEPREEPQLLLVPVWVANSAAPSRA